MTLATKEEIEAIRERYAGPQLNARWSDIRTLLSDREAMEGEIDGLKARIRTAKLRLDGGNDCFDSLEEVVESVLQHRGTVRARLSELDALRTSEAGKLEQIQRLQETVQTLRFDAGKQNAFLSELAVVLGCMSNHDQIKKSAAEKGKRLAGLNVLLVDIGGRGNVPDIVPYEALDGLECVKQRMAELESELAVAEALNDSLGHPVDSPCGHSSIYAVSDDGGANIRCLMCRESKLNAEIDSLRSQREWQPMPMAPRDGTEVRVLHQNTPDERFAESTAVYDSRKGMWVSPDGGDGYDPVGWQPLPPPPSEKG